jgi:hypothetical protein
MTLHKAAYKVARAAPDHATSSTKARTGGAGSAPRYYAQSQAINLEEPPRLISIDVGAIILAPASKSLTQKKSVSSDTEFADVIHSME